MIPAQCRAARALIDWSQTELAKAASVPEASVIAFEKGLDGVSGAEMRRLRRALESAGTEFTDGGGPGVRLIGSGAGEEGLRPDELNSANDT